MKLYFFGIRQDGLISATVAVRSKLGLLGRPYSLTQLLTQS